MCGDLQPHLLGSSTAFAWRTRLTAAWRAPQFKAAQYLRLAEEKGSKTIGNTWYVAFPCFLDSVVFSRRMRVICLSFLALPVLLFTDAVSPFGGDTTLHAHPKRAQGNSSRYQPITPAPSLFLLPFPSFIRVFRISVPSTRDRLRLPEASRPSRARLSGRHRAGRALPSFRCPPIGRHIWQADGGQEPSQPELSC